MKLRLPLRLIAILLTAVLPPCSFASEAGNTSWTIPGTGEDPANVQAEFSQNTAIDLTFSQNTEKSFTAVRADGTTEEVTVTLNSLSLAGGGTATLSGSEGVKVQGTFSTTVYTLEDSNLTLGENVALVYEHTFEVANNKTLILNEGSSLTTTQLRLSKGRNKPGTIEINGGTLMITGTNNDRGNTTGTGASFMLSHWPGSGNMLKLNSGTIDARGAVMYLTWDGTGSYEQTGGEAWVKGISAQNRHEAAANTVARVNLSGGTLHVGSEGLQYVAAVENGYGYSLGAVTIIAEADWATNHGTGTIGLTATGDAATTLNTNGHTVTFNHALGGGGNLVKTGDGTLTFHSTVDGNVRLQQGTIGLNASASLASLTLAENTSLTLSAGLVHRLVLEEGSSLTLSGAQIGSTIENSGALTISGVLGVDSLAHLDAVGDTAYYDRLAGEGSSSGYETSLYSVYKGEGSVVWEERKITAAGITYEVDSTGNVRVGESNGRYFINANKETGAADLVVYGGTNNLAASDTTRVLVLNGGKLELSQELRENVNISLAATSELTINEGIRVSSSRISASEGSNARLTLTGGGIYDVGTTWDLGSSFVLGSGWTGAVRISGGGEGADEEIKNLNLNNYHLSNENSFVNLNGVMGYFAGGQLTQTSNLLLTNGGTTSERNGRSGIDYALWMSNGNSNNAGNYLTSGAGQKVMFSGKIKGDGNVLFSTHTYNSSAKSGPNFLHHEFNGDLSEWTGSYIFSNGIYGANTNNVGDARKAYVGLLGNSDVAASFVVQSIGTNKVNELTVEVGGNGGGRALSGNFERNSSNILHLKTSGNSTKTFSGVLNVSDVTIAGGAVTFSNELTAGSLTAGVDVHLDGAVTAGTLTVNGGTTSLGADSHVSLNTVTLGANGNLSFANGAHLTLTGTLTNAVNISANGAIFTGEGGFVKAGEGTLILFNSTHTATGLGATTLSSTSITGGELQIKTDGGSVDLGSIDLNGGTLSVFCGQYASGWTAISRLTVSAAEARLVASSAQGYQSWVEIQSLSLGGHTLVLEANHDTDRRSVIRLAGGVAGAGTVEVQQTSSGTYRHAVISLAGTETLRSAVLNFSRSESTTADNAVAISATSVKIAGLQGGVATDGKAFKGSLCLISREDCSSDSTTSDGTLRTLTINTAADQSYTFAGTVMDSLNLVKDGAGAQIFSGDVSNFNGSVTVKGGTLTFEQALGHAATLSVNDDATLNLAAATVDTLSLSGTLNLTGTLSVENTLALSDGFTLNMGAGSTLSLGEHHVLDLTGLEDQDAANDGNRVYHVFNNIGEGSVSGLIFAEGSTSHLDMQHLRVNGVGWDTATYANGVITLSRTGTMLTWDAPDTSDMIWNTETRFSGDILFVDNSYVTFKTSVTASLEAAVSLAGLDVEKDVTLTLEPGEQASGATLNVVDINLEIGATLDAGRVSLSGVTAVDLSEGSTLIVSKPVTGAADNGQGVTFTGSGTLQIGFKGEGAGTVHMSDSSRYSGKVKVTDGTVDLTGSFISDGTWSLADGVNAELSGTSANGIVLNGTTHSILVESGTSTQSASVSGGAFTKTGAGTLALDGTVTVEGLTVTDGTVAFGATSSATLGSVTVGANGNLTFAEGSHLTVNGTMDLSRDIAATDVHFTGGDAFVKAGSGTLTLCNGTLNNTGNGTTALSNTTISGGTLEIKTDGKAMNLGKVTLGGGNLTFYFGAVVNAWTNLSLVVNSDSATLEVGKTGHRARVDIQSLSLNGHTFILKDTHKSDSTSVYRLGGADAGEGTVEVQQADDANGTRRNTAVSLLGEETLQKAVLNYSTSSSTVTGNGITYNAVAISADVVKLAGLEGGEGFSERLFLISRLACESDTSGTQYITTSDGTLRTLIFTGDGETHTFSGTVKGSLNLEMTGKGTQKFTGDVSAFNGSIALGSGAGTLVITGNLSADNIATLNGGVLELGGSATFSTLSGTAEGSLSFTGDAPHSLALTGEGATFDGSLTGVTDIRLEDTATGTHKLTKSTLTLDTLSVNGGTLTLAQGANVGTLNLSEGAALSGCGTLTVTDSMSVAGGSISDTTLVYTGTSDVELRSTLSNCSLEVSGDGNLTLASPTAVNLVDLKTQGSITLDTDVTVSHEFNLSSGAHITIENSHLLSYKNWNYIADLEVKDPSIDQPGIFKADDDTVEVRALRMMHTTGGTESEREVMAYSLRDVRLVNADGHIELSGSSNSLQDLVISGGSVKLSGKTTVSGDVNMATPSAQLLLAAETTLSNGIVTIKGKDNTVIDNNVGNALLFAQEGRAIISDADVSIVTQNAESYSWGATLTGDSALTTSGHITLSNTDGHDLSSLTVASGSLTLNGDVIIGSEETAGVLTMNNGTHLEIAVGKKLTDYISVNDGRGVLELTGRTDAANAVLRSTEDGAAFNVDNDKFTIVNAKVTVTTANALTVAAKLSDSEVIVQGSGTATVKVQEDAVNDYVATEGSVKIETSGPAKVGNLTVGADKTVTVSGDNGAGTLELTGQAEVRGGSVVANVEVKAGASMTTSAAGVGGDLTVEGGGTLAVAPSDGSAACVEVSGILTLEADATLRIEEITTFEKDVVLATAQGGIIMNAGVQIADAGLSSSSHLSVRLETRNATASVSLFAAREAQDDGGNTLVATRTNNEVSTVSALSSGNVITLTTNLDQDYINSLIAAKNYRLDLHVSDELVQALIKNANGSHAIAISLDGLDVSQITTLSLNGYVGFNNSVPDASGAVYNPSGVFQFYDPAQVPEPASAAFSLLALATLAARRRRRA